MKVLFPYQQIAQVLRDRILQGDYRGKKLPSERELLQEFGVQRDTIRRALQILEEEGRFYRDSAGGRHVMEIPARKVGPSSFALMMPRAENSYAPLDMLRGLTEVARGADRSVLWLDAESKFLRPGESLPTPEVMQAHGIEAMILWPEIPADLERLRALRAALPIVVLDRRVPGFETDFVGFDDLEGGKQATEHLLSLGHTRIGFVSNEPFMITVQLRIQGYLSAMKEAGTKPPPEWIWHYFSRRLSGPSALLKSYLAAEGDPLTAIVCSNDAVAIQLIALLRDLQIRVPEDIAITGFGNVLLPLPDAQQLTTMVQPFEQMGRRAGQCALARLEGKPAGVQEITLPMKLIVRGSSIGFAPSLPPEK